MKQTTTNTKATTMTFDEIKNMQTAATIKFEVAKKIVILLATAEAEFDEIEHDLDWHEQLGEIQRMVFEE